MKMDFGEFVKWNPRCIINNIPNHLGIKLVDVYPDVFCKGNIGEIVRSMAHEKPLCINMRCMNGIIIGVARFIYKAAVFPNYVVVDMEDLTISSCDSTDQNEMVDLSELI